MEINETTGKKNSKNSLFYIALLAVTGLLICICSGSYILYDYSVSPSGTGDEQRVFVVKPGQGFSSVTLALVKEKFVISPKKFKIYGALTGNDKKIKTGEYMLSPSMTTGQMISVLTSGKVCLYKLTIPEGYNIYQVAEVVASGGFSGSKEFLAAVNNKKLLKKLALNPEYATFEGYLFPDTYSFPRNVKPSEIIRVMVSRFKEIYKPEWEKRAEKIGLTMHEAITLASIIEKETGDARERPVISSVFHNRLKKRMRLETDPTVIYGIKDFDGNITRKHLRERTPYNTYKIKGLPPGPIANPGLKSIEAALYPAETDYLFFVSKKDTTHQFSTNIRDHINSVRKYQLRRKRKK